MVVSWLSAGDSSDEALFSGCPCDRRYLRMTRTTFTQTKGRTGSILALGVQRSSLMWPLNTSQKFWKKKKQTTQTELRGEQTDTLQCFYCGWVKNKDVPLVFLLPRHLIPPAGAHLHEADGAKPAPLLCSQHLHENHIGFNVLAGALDGGTAETVKASVPAGPRRPHPSCSQYCRWMFT